MPPPPHTASQVGPQRKTRNAADHLGLSRFCLTLPTSHSGNSRDADEDREGDIIPRRHKRLGRASANPLALQLHTQPPNIIPNLPRGHVTHRSAGEQGSPCWTGWMFRLLSKTTKGTETRLRGTQKRLGRDRWIIKPQSCPSIMRPIFPDNLCWAPQWP